ncbi:c-type cytochrome [Roseimaritima ulvae]|uniref:Cytochrome c-552 n=1 Tax=Roseimaritima ulvae TaxID=980254 RepID=A0A5B9QYZ1_9BACT|nr:c-type cytochrome [Roseimaritima ulvae]QEG43169.1 Cytochrome c-552 precursor [Roseimaritima ulvae]
MKITLRRAAAGVSVIAVLGVIVLVSGVFPIKASSGHWPVTRWLLDFASDRSVAFHARGIQPPALDGEPMLILGAATYESNCAFCHGRPGESQPPVALAMTPTPPHLSGAVQDKHANELFYIVKHGIKFAGMPAWPTQRRDDEVWPVVALLERFPDLSGDEYRRLIDVQLPADTPQVVSHCAACHGVDGNGRGGERVPVLAGQSEAYLRKSLLAYRSGQRYSGVMMPVAHRLTDQDITVLSAYYANQARAAQEAPNPDDRIRFEEGQTLALEGHTQDKIPSCVDCHGPTDNPRSEDYPSLVGQSQWYIIRQLELLARQDRGGSEDVSLMHPVADKLTAQQRRALAIYYAAAKSESK